MSTATHHLENIVSLLRKKEIYNIYITYIPTPDYIQGIIFLANHGKIKQAYKKINKLENLQARLEDELDAKDKEWLAILISMLHNALNAIGQIA